MSGRLGLAAGDERRAVGFAAEVAACDDRDSFGALVHTLPELIGADALFFASDLGLGAPGGGITMAADASDPTVYDDHAIHFVSTRWRQHPVISRQVRGLLPRHPLKVSDFVSEREWRRRELFAEVFGRIGLPYELSSHLSRSRGRDAGVVLHRSGSDFSERDRELVGLVTPHLRAALARVTLLEERSGHVALLERGLEALGGALVLVDLGGRITLASAEARATLRRWFGPSDGPARLPTEVADWLAATRKDPAPTALVRARAGELVALKLVASPGGEAILIEERRQAPPEPAALAAALPITARQAEVLALVVSGRSNDAIARVLSISVHTARHHVEQIYARLGVRTRAAATASALGAVDRRPAPRPPPPE